MISQLRAVLGLVDAADAANKAWTEAPVGNAGKLLAATVKADDARDEAMLSFFRTFRDELEAQARDAARYRWLRAQEVGVYAPTVSASLKLMQSEFLDAM